MRLFVLPTPEKCIEQVALFVLKSIEDFRPSAKAHFVLGIPYAFSSKPFFQALTKQAKKKRFSFQYVTIFAMASYVGVEKGTNFSIESFLFNNFFKHIDIDPKNVHTLNGMAANLEEECNNYESLIDSVGPVDLFVCTVEHFGHIAFNEPGCSLTSLTRIKPISLVTQKSLEKDFEEGNGPTLCLTVGIGTIMKSVEVLFYMTGFDKADAVKQAFEGGVSTICPISMFQQHPRVVVFTDNDATNLLQLRTVQYFQRIRDVLTLYNV